MTWPGVAVREDQPGASTTLSASRNSVVTSSSVGKTANRAACAPTSPEQDEQRHRDVAGDEHVEQRGGQRHHHHDHDDHDDDRRPSPRHTTGRHRPTSWLGAPAGSRAHRGRPWLPLRLRQADRVGLRGQVRGRGRRRRGRTSRRSSGAVYAVRLVALGYLAAAASLLFWSHAPQVIGWQPRVVLTVYALPLSPGNVALIGPRPSARGRCRRDTSCSSAIRPQQRVEICTGSSDTTTPGGS